MNKPIRNLVFGLVMGGLGLAIVNLPFANFEAGQPIRATEINANFRVLKEAIEAGVADRSIGTNQLVDGTVTANKIAAAPLPGAKGQVLTWDGSALSWQIPVGSGGVADGAVTTPKLGPNAVTVAKLADGAVTTAKLGDGAVTTAKLADNAVATAQLADKAVATAELADGAVVTAKLSDGAITAAKIAAAAPASSGQVLTWNGTAMSWQTAAVADGSIGTAKLADVAVTDSKLASAAVTNAKLANSSVSVSKIAATVPTSSGQVLTWNGTAMSWQTPSGGGGSDSMLSISSSSTGACTEINNNLTNDSPTALLLVTPVLPLSGTVKPVGVFYDTVGGRWNICTLDQSLQASGVKYTILVRK